MSQSRPLFVYFRPFLITISIIQIETSIDGEHGMRTCGRRIEGTDETMELWRPKFVDCYLQSTRISIIFGLSKYYFEFLLVFPSSGLSNLTPTKFQSFELEENMLAVPTQVGRPQPSLMQLTICVINNSYLLPSPHHSENGRRRRRERNIIQMNHY